MKIERIGFMHYQVEGESGTYSCCLESNRFKGHCSCGHHVHKVQPAYNRGEAMEPCKHIEPVKVFAWDEVAPLLAAEWMKGSRAI